MPRINRPFYRKQKGSWYARIRGSLVSLGVTGRSKKRQAHEAFYKLKSAKVDDAPTPRLVRDLVEAFLSDAKPRMSSGCYRNYRIFAEHLRAEFGLLQAERLSDTSIEAYARSRVDWSPTYQHQFLSFVVTVYRFACDKRVKLVGVNPLERVRKPGKVSRGVESVITESEHKKLLRKCRNPMFADFLRLLWATGARPGELAGINEGQVRAAPNRVIPLTEHKNSRRGLPRFLLFNDEAWTILKRRASTGEDSKLLFTGQSGERFSAKAIGGRLTRLARRAGVRHTVPYGYRHTFATDALSKGIPDASVAAMLGHSSTTMLHKHYSHLTSRIALLRSELGKVR